MRRLGALMILAAACGGGDIDAGGNGVDAGMRTLRLRSATGGAGQPVRSLSRIVRAALRQPGLATRAVRAHLPTRPCFYE